jgi:hypothetical protein
LIDIVELETQLEKMYPVITEDNDATFYSEKMSSLGSEIPCATSLFEDVSH